MEIIPLGHASFKLKGKNASVVTDPYDPQMTGLKFPRNTSADIVTISHDHKDHNCAKLIEPATDKIVVLNLQGEYEIKGIEIMGIKVFHDTAMGKERGANVIFRFDIDGVSLVHLGDLGHKLTQAQIDMLDGVDVLFVPVGKIVTLDFKSIEEIISEFEPGYVIPMHYRRDGQMTDTFKDLATLSEFLKEMGQTAIMPLPKIKITKDALPEKTQIVVLE